MIEPTKLMAIEEVKAIVYNNEHVTVNEVCYHSDKYGASYRKIEPLKLKVYNAAYYEAIGSNLLRKSNYALDQNGTIVQEVFYTDSLMLHQASRKVYTNTSTGRTFLLVERTPDYLYELLFMPGMKPITLREYEELLQSDFITVTHKQFESRGKRELVECHPVTCKVKQVSTTHNGWIFLDIYGKKDVLGWPPKIIFNLDKGIKYLCVYLPESEYESTVRKAKIESLEIEIDRHQNLSK